MKEQWKLSQNCSSDLVFIAFCIHYIAFITFDIWMPLVTSGSYSRPPIEKASSSEFISLFFFPFWLFGALFLDKFTLWVRPVKATTIYSRSLEKTTDPARHFKNFLMLCQYPTMIHVLGLLECIAFWKHCITGFYENGGKVECDGSYAWLESVGWCQVMIPPPPPTPLPLHITTILTGR